MIVFDAETKVLDIEIFPWHNIAELNSNFTFIVLPSQEKPLQRKGKNTHTHTHTSSVIFWFKKLPSKEKSKSI